MSYKYHMNKTTDDGWTTVTYKKNKKIKFYKNIDEFAKQFLDYTPPLYDITDIMKTLKKIKKELKNIGVKFYISY
jgi:cob(I)alamin adenosyltransferase